VTSSSGESRDVTSRGGSDVTGRPRRGDLVVTVGLLVVFAGAFLLSLAWPFRTALFPRLLTATGAALAVLKLVALAVQARRSAGVAHPERQVRDAAGNADHSLEYVFASAGTRAWGAALAWIGGYFVCLWLLGLVRTVPLFALLYLRVAGKAGWPAAAAYAAAAGAVMYVVFGRLLSVPMPTGVF
jgi:hypothetical protein